MRHNNEICRGWFVTMRRYVVRSRKAAEFVLRSPELFASRQRAAPAGLQAPLVPAGFDPPEHTRYRQVIQPFFSPRSASAQQPVVGEVARRMIDGLAGRTECDVAAELTVGLPAAALLALLGLPLADGERLTATMDCLKRVETVFHQNSPLDRPGMREGDDTAGSGLTAGASDRIAEAAGSLREYFASHIAAGRGRKSGDGVLAQLCLTTSGDRLTDEELLSLLVQLTVAGLDTVTAALNVAFVILAVNGDLRARLARDTDVVNNAVEELLRLAGINPVIPRTATRQVELCGEVIPAGSRIQVDLGAVGRDRAFHQNPHAIDIARSEPHMAFGSGPHRCLGAHLARMQIRTVLMEWHRRIPDYRLWPGMQPEQAFRAAVTGTKSLPLMIGRASDK